MPKIASMLVVGLAVCWLVGCGAGEEGSSARNRRVDTEALARELSRELPGLHDNPAFQIEVRQAAEVCTSSIEDFRTSARSAGADDRGRRFRRQIKVGCPWRLGDVDAIFTKDAEDDSP